MRTLRKRDHYTYQFRFNVKLLGEKFLYTTHGWSLISAIVENVINMDKPKEQKRFTFEEIVSEVCETLQMSHTCFDRNEPLIENRSRYE